MKHKEGLLFGAIGLSIFAAIALVENVEAYPFAIILVAVSGLLAIASFWSSDKSQKIIKNKPSFSERMASKHHIERTSSLISFCNIISNVVQKYNQENKTKVQKDDVASFIIQRRWDEIKNSSVGNLLFGINVIGYICCVMFSDEEYKKLKGANYLVCKTFSVDGVSTEELVKDFDSIMDTVYVNFHLEMFENAEFNAQDNHLFNGGDLFDETIKIFAAKYKLNLDDLN